MECSICCEKFNKQKHFKIACPACDIEMCRTCVQTYLLETTQDPHCMSCRKEWSRDFIDESCTKVFCNGKLKEHRQNTLFERQKCLMPSTQPAVERTLLIREAESEEEKLIEEVRMIEHRLYAHRRHMTELRQTNLSTQGSRREFVRKCPVDDCKGFLSSQWKCGICKNDICKDCNEIKQEGHECDPGAKATVDLLKKDTKACPKCGTLIFKISGCSQMWCPDCHVAFNWNTLQIETGIIHNPHFYEFQRRGGGGGRNHGDIPCGGMPSLLELREARLGVDNHNILTRIHRIVGHIEAYEMRMLNTRERDYTRLRVSYMLNEIDEDRFKKVIQREEKKLLKDRSIYDLFQMVVNTVGDMLRQLVLKVITEEETVTNINCLMGYFNENSEKIARRFNQITPRYRDNGIIWI